MALFDIPEPPKKRVDNNKPNIKLKKGQTLQDLINMARQIVMEKLGKYKDTSKCITDINELRKFFEETEGEIGIDTETTGLNFYQDKIVGLSLCNGKDALYVPINHKSSIYNTRLKGQIPEEELKQLFKEVCANSKYKWIYHNAKFDLRCITNIFRFFNASTILGYFDMCLYIRPR